MRARRQAKTACLHLMIWALDGVCSFIVHLQSRRLQIRCRYGPTKKGCRKFRQPFISHRVDSRLTTAAESSTPSSAGTGLLRTGSIHRQRTATELRAVQRRNRSFGFTICRHFNKAKSPGLPSKLVRDDPCRGHTPMRGEQIAQLLLSR